MVYWDKIIKDMDDRIRQLEIDASSSRFPNPGDHDYIVGKIDGIKEDKNQLLAIKKETESVDDFDDEDEDRKFSTKARTNAGRRFSQD